ncbi:MAG: hypothetical protein J6A25_00430 [Lachnospiraceae bacterium]|nr:hypothetical protein [Lachnospiraceae bacterium]
MRTNLLETYSRQLKVAEAYVAKTFDGKAVSNNTKLTTAVLLDNTNRWITESMNSTLAGTQRSDLGDWKKFCLNLTNIAVPSLIANDLVIVHPMTSYSGSVAYLEYVAKTDKNGMKGKTLNSVFGLGESSEARTNYTSQIVVETVEGKTTGEGDEATTTYETALPAVEGGLTYIAENGVDVKRATYRIDGVYTDTLTAGKVAYVAQQFQMETTPATEIPTIGPVMKRIALVAEPRRIAVKYDQITAFQAKTDYGFSLDKQIAEQACGELAYEIDTEIVRMLADAAFAQDDKLTWSKTLPVGVSKFEHYNGFLETIEDARAIIYKRTKKFHPNYMVIAADVLPVLKFVNGFSANKVGKMNGPYKVGSIDGLDVYVSPELDGGKFFMGLNGSDMMSSAGVYAPYMAIVPTQLLGTPDGGLAQGFSTWYAKALLNKNLLVAGEIVA